MLDIIDEELKKYIERCKTEHPADLLAEIYARCKNKQLYDIVLERMYMLQYEQGIIILPKMLKMLYKSDYTTKNDGIVHTDEPESNMIHIVAIRHFSPGLVYKFLDKLDLVKTKKVVIRDVITYSSELNIKEYPQYDLVDGRFEDVLDEELERFYPNKERIKL